MTNSPTRAEYSVLLLAINDKTIPFKPARFEAHNTHTEWSTIPDTHLSQEITSQAVAFFHENQSQHGTNTVVRIDLQHDAKSGIYTSTSITRLPDQASHTPGLVDATVPGGQGALDRLLVGLKQRHYHHHHHGEPVLKYGDGVGNGNGGVKDFIGVESRELVMEN